jgi:hypothetical protein
MSSVDCSINPAGTEFWLLLIAILSLAALCEMHKEKGSLSNCRIIRWCLKGYWRNSISARLKLRNWIGGKGEWCCSYRGCEGVPA